MAVTVTVYCKMTARNHIEREQETVEHLLERNNNIIVSLARTLSLPLAGSCLAKVPIGILLLLHRTIAPVVSLAEPVCDLVLLGLVSVGPLV